MAGNRPYSAERFRELALYVGQHPLRAGRVALAVILWQSDFDAYAKRGKSITGAVYVKAPHPGEVWCPRSIGLLAAIKSGWWLGGVEHRLRTGRFTREDATRLERTWHGRVPI